MHSSQKALILILLLHAAGSQTYTVTQQFHTNSFSDDDIVSTPNPWTLSGANIPPYRFFTDCAGTRLLGGYKVLSGDNTNPAFLQKSWTNLPPHFAMTISMKIYKIDSWNTDSFFIMVDGVSSQIYTWGSTTGASDICGQPNPLINSFNPQYNEYVQSYSQTIAHSSPTLTIKLISSLKSWTGSWGIRQLSIKLSRCHLSCLTCTNASVCATCDNTNGLTTVGQFCQCSASGVRKLIMTNCPITNCVSCVAACPSGYFSFNATSCASCNTACATCIGPASLLPDCTSCNPQGYIDPGTSVCTVCYGTCASCTGILLNQCTSCQYGSFLNANRCLTSCPTGTYGLQSSKSCVPCNSPCATCDGSSVNHCLSCVATFFLYQTTCSNPCPFSMYGYNGLCVSSCPLGTYPDTTATPLCINCPAFCQTCDQTGLCITCVSGAYFSPYDNLCHNPCLGSYYGDNQTFVCAACDPSCLTCHGPTSGQCNSCPPLTYLVYSTCYSTCPPHTYSLTCILCHSSCLNCSGPSSTECTSCNKLQMFHLNKSQCVDSCYDGDISNNAEMTCITCPTGETGYFKKCVPCFATCNTCDGIWYTDCESCVNKSSSTGLMFDFSKKLDNKTIVYHTSSKTCIYEDTGIVYMPSTTNTDGQMYTALLFMIWANIGLTILLQFLFKYKTNLLLTLEAMQLFSYLYYFSSPLSESNQILLLTLYNSHPTYLLSAHNIVPSATQLLSLSATTQKLFPKASILSKTGIFIIDTFYFHIIMLIIIILFVIIRISCKDWPLYHKSNPYLITYSFRLLFTQFLFAALLFISYGGLSDDLSKAGLAILVLDCVLLACSLFWKVRTEQQIQHAHYALFYFNQLGPKTGQYKQLNHQKSLQRTMNLQDQKVQKQVNLESQVISKKPSILPSLLHYLSRIPIVLTLTLFTNQPITQSICLLIYSIFLLGINLVLQYRRRIYRFMTLSVYLAFVICAMFLVLMCCNLSVWIGFDFIIVALFAGLLLCTVGQLLESVLAYFWAKFCGRSSN